VVYYQFFAEKGRCELKRLFVGLIISGLCFFGTGANLSMAGGLSQDPEALSFLGSYEGTVLARGCQRDWEITLFAVDDSGKVTVSRYHLGPAGGSFPAEDVPDVTGIFKHENGQPAIFLDVPGRAKIVLTQENGGLSAKLVSSNIGGRTIHLKKK
jgi:hypothetical protein